jgi:hypothetical protein
MRVATTHSAPTGGSRPTVMIAAAWLVFATLGGCAGDVQSQVTVIAPEPITVPTVAAASERAPEPAPAAPADSDGDGVGASDKCPDAAENGGNAAGGAADRGCP